MTTASETGGRRLRGLVVGNRCDKTVRVKIEIRVRHPLYGKIMRLHGNVEAHDANNSCQLGDQVVLQESPRFSKTKAWLVVEITPAKESV